MVIRNAGSVGALMGSGLGCELSGMRKSERGAARLNCLVGGFDRSKYSNMPQIGWYVDYNALLRVDISIT